MTYCYTGENSLDSEAAIDLQPPLSSKHSHTYIHNPVIHFLTVKALPLNTATFSRLVCISYCFSFQSTCSHHIYLAVLYARLTLLSVLTVRRHRIACASAYKQLYGVESFLNSQLRSQTVKNFPKFYIILVLFLCARVRATGPTSGLYLVFFFLVFRVVSFLQLQILCEIILF